MTSGQIFLYGLRGRDFKRKGLAKKKTGTGKKKPFQGDYAVALDYYKKSLEISEQIGDRAGIASSHGQLGTLLIDTKKFPEALEHSLLALTIFTEFRSTNVNMAIKTLVKLRSQWGEKEFAAGVC